MSNNDETNVEPVHTRKAIRIAKSSDGNGLGMTCKAGDYLVPVEKPTSSTHELREIYPTLAEIASGEFLRVSPVVIQGQHYVHIPAHSALDEVLQPGSISVDEFSNALPMKKGMKTLQTLEEKANNHHASAEKEPPSSALPRIHRRRFQMHQGDELDPHREDTDILPARPVTEKPNWQERSKPNDNDTKRSFP